MVYGKWLDFYMHVVWHSRTDGVLEIWYRVEGEQQFEKLYSNVPGGGALIQVPPHPTLLYNTENGALGENRKPGPELEGGFYRANTAWTNEYWWGWDEAPAERGGDLGGVPEPAHATGPNAAAARSPATCTFSAPTGENRPPNPRAR